MKKTLLILLAIAVIVFSLIHVYGRYNTSASTSSFDEYGVWKIVNNDSLYATEWQSFGPADVSRLERYINYHFYAKTSDDSLKIILKVYGMMSYSAADSLMGTLIYNHVLSARDSIISVADTLDADEDYPYIRVCIQNRDTNTNISSSYLWAHARPIEKTVIRSR